MTTSTNQHYGKNLLFILMVGLIIYFAINSCTHQPDIHVTTPTEWDSINKAKADSINKMRADSLLNDSLQKAIIVTIRKDSLSVDTTKKQ